MSRNVKLASDMIPKATLLKYKGQHKTPIAVALKRGYLTVEKSIQYHGISDQFPRRGVSSFIVPKYEITLAMVEPYYSGTIAEAARALGCEYNTFEKGISRKRLNHKFNGGPPEKDLVYCCICHKNIVEYKYKMCQPCKVGW